MPSLDELLNKAQKQNKPAEQKKFSRGNRPDTLMNASIDESVKTQQIVTPAPISENAPQTVKTKKVQDKVSTQPVKESSLLEQKLIVSQSNSESINLNSPNKTDVETIVEIQATQNSSYNSIKDSLLTQNESSHDASPVFNLEALNELKNQASTNSRENLEIIERKSRELNLEKGDFSRYSLENTQRIPREIDDIPRENLDFLQVKPRDIPREYLEKSERKNSESGVKKYSISHLVGLQKKVLFSLFQLCRNNNANFTKDISGGELALICETSMYNAQNAVKELIKKHLLFRREFKAGRGGYTKYEIDQDTYLEIFEYLKANDPILEKTQRKPREQSRENLEKVPSSKLVSNNNTNFLTREEEPILQNSSFDVSSIDVSRLGQYGITRKQIQDIQNQKLIFTTFQLQDFVERFEVYASDPKNISGIRSVPGMFVKMAQLAADGKDPLIGVETETDRLIREQLERIKKQREDRLEKENELRELEFETWVELLDENERDQLVPPNGILKAGSQSQKIMLKNHFIEMVWPKVKNSLGKN